MNKIVKQAIRIENRYSIVAKYTMGHYYEGQHA